MKRIDEITIAKGKSDGMILLEVVKKVNSLITAHNSQLKTDPAQGLVEAVESKFKHFRLNSSTHLGLGDIRLTIGAQEEIVDLIKNYKKGR